MHGGIGDDESGSAVREDHICDLCFRPDVERFLRVEFLQPGEEVRPEEVRVGLHEDVPLCIVFIPERLLHHREKFPLVKLPAGVIRFPDSGVGLVCEIVPTQTRASHLLDAVVDAKVRNSALDLAVHVAQGVPHPHAADVFLEVGEYHVVGHAAEGGLEVHGDLVEGFSYASFHDHQHVFHPREWRAFGAWVRVMVSCGGGAGVAGLGGEEVVQGDEA